MLAVVSARPLRCRISARLSSQEELLAADPANATIRKDLGYTHRRIGDFAANAQDNAEALLHFSKALKVYRLWRGPVCHAGAAWRRCGRAARVPQCDCFSKK